MKEDQKTCRRSQIRFTKLLSTDVLMSHRGTSEFLNRMVAMVPIYLSAVEAVLQLCAVVSKYQTFTDSEILKYKISKNQKEVHKSHLLTPAQMSVSVKTGINDLLVIINIQKLHNFIF